MAVTLKQVIWWTCVAQAKIKCISVKLTSSLCYSYGIYYSNQEATCYNYVLSTSHSNNQYFNVG